jgi:hypothetical protein
MGAAPQGQAARGGFRAEMGAFAGPVVAFRAYRHLTARSWFYMLRESGGQGPEGRASETSGPAPPPGWCCSLGGGRDDDEGAA